MAQRLHRIPKPHRQLVPWVALKEQFGQDYDRVRKFREVFLQALRQVHLVYPTAKLDVNAKGLCSTRRRRRSRRPAGGAAAAALRALDAS